MSFQIPERPWEVLQAKMFVLFKTAIQTPS